MYAYGWVAPLWSAITAFVAGSIASEVICYSYSLCVGMNVSDDMCVSGGGRACV